LESVDRRGRIKAESEYIGEKYYFTSGQETAPPGETSPGAVRVGLAFLRGGHAPLLRRYAHGVCVAPFVFSALPLGMLTALTAETLPLREPLEHRHAESWRNGYPVRALFTAVMPALSCWGRRSSSSSHGRI
jgi:hypothetical protein